VWHFAQSSVLVVCRWGTVMNLDKVSQGVGNVRTVPSMSSGDGLGSMSTVDGVSPSTFQSIRNHRGEAILSETRHAMHRAHDRIILF
jgi:hypothetical protein